jgi:hypothetical protein
LPDEKEAIHQVVGAYFDAFARDPAVAAAFYGEPTLIVLPNEVRALATRSDVEAFLAKLLGQFAAVQSAASPCRRRCSHRPTR